MKITQALFYVVGLLLCSASVQAAEEESLSMEFVELLFGSPDSELRVYPGRMDAFPPFNPPDNVEIVGSMDQGMSRRLVLRSRIQRMK